MEKCREKVETAAQQTELLSEEAVEQMSNQELLFLYRESGDEELKWKLVLRMTGRPGVGDLQQLCPAG